MVVQGSVGVAVPSHHGMADRRREACEEGVGAAGAVVHGVRHLPGELRVRRAGNERREAAVRAARSVHHWAEGGRAGDDDEVRQAHVQPRQELAPCQGPRAGGD